MDKAPDAFRTISEVAEVLNTPAHVLRFWESRFPQIRPVKRAGGRRYYRPGDVALLAGIRHLLHDRGLTIRGVQTILRESGVRHVQALSQTGLTGDDLLAGPAAMDETPDDQAVSTEIDEIEAIVTQEFLKDATAAQPAPDADAAAPSPRPMGVVERMRAQTPPPANLPLFAEDVPEAPFVEVETPSGAEVVILPRKRRSPGQSSDPMPGLFDALPDPAARPAGPAGTSGPGQDTAPQAESPPLAADRVATVPSQTADPTPAAPAEPDRSTEPPADAPTQGMAWRLRHLPHAPQDETRAALRPVLTRARALQARLAGQDHSQG